MLSSTIKILGDALSSFFNYLQLKELLLLGILCLELITLILWRSKNILVQNFTGIFLVIQMLILSI